MHGSRSPACAEAGWSRRAPPVNGSVLGSLAFARHWTSTMFTGAPLRAQILERVLPERLHGRLAYLSGPSFAAEVAAGLPTVVTIASKDEAVAQRAQTLLSSPRFRCYRTTDVAGMDRLGFPCLHLIPARLPESVYLAARLQIANRRKHPHRPGTVEHCFHQDSVRGPGQCGWEQLRR